jgi:hypothetical protein
VPDCEGTAARRDERPRLSPLSGFNLSLAIPEHATEQPGEFMGAGAYCRRGSETNLDASEDPITVWHKYKVPSYGLYSRKTIQLKLRGP